jgi:hypothetical protein
MSAPTGTELSFRAPRQANPARMPVSPSVGRYTLTVVYYGQHGLWALRQVNSAVDGLIGQGFAARNE